MANDAVGNYGVVHDYDAVTNANAKGYASEENIHDKLPLTNKTGSSAVTGEVYVIDTSTSMGFVAASGASDLRPVVVVPQNIKGTNTPSSKTILNNEIGWMFAGDAYLPVVDCDTAAVAIGDYLKLSATAKKATSSGKNAASAPPPLGSFAIALSSKSGGSNGQVQAKMLGHSFYGLAGRALSDSAPALGQGLVWNSITSTWEPTPLPVLLSLSAADTAISNSAAETSVFSVTVPGGLLGTNNVLLLHMFAEMANATGSNQSFTTRLKYGGSTVFTNTTSSSLATGFTIQDFLWLWLKGNGATNSQRGSYAGLLGGYGGSGTAAVDSTQNQTLEVTIALSAASANLTWTRRFAMLYLLKNT